MVGRVIVRNIWIYTSPQGRSGGVNHGPQGGRSDRVGSSDGRSDRHRPEGRTDRIGRSDARRSRHRPKAGGSESCPAASTQCETEGGGSETRPGAERDSAETKGRPNRELRVSATSASELREGEGKTDRSGRSDGRR